MQFRLGSNIALSSANRRLKPNRLIATSCLAVCIWFAPLMTFVADAQQTGAVDANQVTTELRRELTGDTASERGGLDFANEIPGVIRPEREAKLSAQISSQVLQAVSEEGRTFERGQVLVAFDCRELRQELAAAKARKTEMYAELESARYLVKHGAGSRLESKIASARAKRASAEEGLVHERIKNCVIRAPFDGSIASSSVQPHEVTSIRTRN